MKVAVMFSGGKDSTATVHYALNKGWDVEALIAVKPKNTEAYLWHYPTVEWTVLQSEAMEIPLILVKTNDIGSKTEANVLEGVFSRLGAEAILLGGVGLQKTQIREIEKVAKKFGKKVIVPFSNLNSQQLLEHELNQGYDIRITNVATDGLNQDWIGKRLNFETMIDLKHLSNKHGFDVLGEGGSYDSLVLDAPMFKKRIEILQSDALWNGTSGYLDIKEARLVPKDNF